MESPSKGMFPLSKPARYYMVDLAFLRGLTWIQDSIERSHKKNVISSSSSTLWGGIDGNFCLSFLAAPPSWDAVSALHGISSRSYVKLRGGSLVFYPFILPCHQALGRSESGRREINADAWMNVNFPRDSGEAGGVGCFLKVCRYYTSPFLYYLNVMYVYIYVLACVYIGNWKHSIVYLGTLVFIGFVQATSTRLDTANVAVFLATKFRVTLPPLNMS